MNTIELNIAGMTCDHCVRATTQALQGVPGVEQALVTLQPGGAVVQGEANPAALIAAVKKAGYDAKLRG